MFSLCLSLWSLCHVQTFVAQEKEAGERERGIQEKMRAVKHMKEAEKRANAIDREAEKARWVSFYVCLSSGVSCNF